MGKRLESVKKNAILLKTQFKYQAGKASKEDFIKAMDDSTAAAVHAYPKKAAKITEAHEKAKKALGL
jgi:hypothetical protein